MTDTPAPNEMPEYDVDGKKIDALYRLNSATMLYDMPECERFGPFEGADIMEVIEECQAWRETHATDLNNPLACNPNYCAAKEALKEHLQHCSAKSADLRAPVAAGGEALNWKRQKDTVFAWAAEHGFTPVESEIVDLLSALQQPPAPAVDLEKMSAAYEEERAKYGGGMVYYPNNAEAFKGCMAKALAAQGMIKGVE